MGIITTERLTKILSETQAVISECNARGVHGSVEVNARLFENVLMELLRHRAVMLQGAENDESPTTMQTAPALDSSQIIAESPSGNSPVIPDGWVACSERMPSVGEQVLAYRQDAPESNDPLIKMATYIGVSAHGHGFDCYWKPTHWMPLPAAPQRGNENDNP